MLCCGFNLLMLAKCAYAALRHTRSTLCDLKADQAAQLEAHLCLFIYLFILFLLIQSELLQAVP